MSDLTLEEKTTYAKQRAALDVVEKHFYDAAQPFFPLGFSVGYRNPGHWDIYAKQCPGKATAFNSIPGQTTSAQDGQTERAFRIRGEQGKVVVMDERWNPHGRKAPPEFKSVLGAMLWITEELMQEPS